MYLFIVVLFIYIFAKIFSKNFRQLKLNNFNFYKSNNELKEKY